MKQQTDKNGNTLLHWAAAGTNVALLRSILAEDGYDVNAKNLRGERPLAIAFKHGMHANLAELARSGAHPITERELGLANIRREIEAERVRVLSDAVVEDYGGQAGELDDVVFWIDLRGTRKRLVIARSELDNSHETIDGNVARRIAEAFASFRS
jgi:ankyrin repeat protein